MLYLVLGLGEEGTDAVQSASLLHKLEDNIDEPLLLEALQVAPEVRHLDQRVRLQRG